MAMVYLAGHGSWDIKSNGFVTVPKGVSVTFYTEAMKNLFTADMFSIISGTYTGDVKQLYEPGAQVPNYTLHPDTVNEARCRQLLKARVDKYRKDAGATPKIGLMMPIAGQTTTLGKLLGIMGPGTNVVWCACRYTELKDVGGKSVGVNGAQGSFGNRDNQGNIGPGDIYFNPGASNASVANKGIDLQSHLEYALASRRKALGYG